MKTIDRERGANVRANLARWKRKLLMLLGVWLLLTVLVLGALVAHATSNHLSARRANALASSGGTAMAMVLIAGVLVTLVVADRRTPPD